MSALTFDEQVAALRGKVEPKRLNIKKSDATPEQWAANLDHHAKYRRANPDVRKAAERAYAQRYPDRRRASARASGERHRDRRRANSLAYYYANREKCIAQNRAHHRGRWHSDPAFRIARNLRTRLRLAIKNKAKSGSAVHDLGCSVESFIDYIERQWYGGMTWETWGFGPGRWQIDHIYPLAKADLSDRAQLLAVCNWRNLRPLWHDDHAPKKDSVTAEAQALFSRLCHEFSGRPA